MEDLQEIHLVSTDSIQLNPFQPRKQFEPESLEELAESIRSIGLLQPPVVRLKEEGVYELISGERRFRAAQLAGLKTIPVIVRTFNIHQSAEAALIENVQRVDLNPLEIAEGFYRLMTEFHLTQDEVSSRIGKKRSTIANYLRLLSLPKPVRDALSSSSITMGHAKAILALETEEEQLKLFQMILENKLNVRDAETSAKSISNSTSTNSKLPLKSIHISAIQEALQRKLGTKVVIRGNESKGTILIDYYSLDDLDRLMELFEIQDAIV